MLARRGDEVISRYFEEPQRSQRAKETADRDLGEELLIQGTSAGKANSSLENHNNMSAVRGSGAGWYPYAASQADRPANVWRWDLCFTHFLAERLFI